MPTSIAKHFPPREDDVIVNQENYTAPPTKPLRILAATACIGYGFTEIALNRALSTGIDFIGADAGSMDPGPFYLGAGKPYVSPEAIERDLKLLLKAARQHDIPLIIGSAGGSGGTPHLQLTRDIVECIIREERLHAKLAVIGSEPPRELITQRFAENRIHGLWPALPIDEQTITNSERIVAMMGAEPLQQALRLGANVILAGRCSDSAIYAAIPTMLGYDPALAWHLGKTIECGATIASPKTGQDCIIGTLGADYFTVEPGHPEKCCTVTKVAAHTMYENPSPYEFVEPSGIINTKLCTYEAIDDRTVKVAGTTFEKAPIYTVKLEGAALAGWRAVMFAGVRDPILIANIKSFTQQIHERTFAEVEALGADASSYTLTVRRYGLDAVLGEAEPLTDKMPHEIGLMLDVVAHTEQLAEAILAKARYIAMHTEFEGRLCTAGNLAMPFSPSDIPVGPAYRFSVWHAMELNDPLEIFPIEIFDLGNKEVMR